MIVTTDEAGRYLGHLDSGFPAQPDVLQRVRDNSPGKTIVDVPPFTPDFWYFPNGVPTIRPTLDYAVTERKEDTDTVILVSGIPAGVMVEVIGPSGSQSVETDDEPLELYLREPGEYRVAFDAFPYLPARVYINVLEGDGAENGET